MPRPVLYLALAAWALLIFPTTGRGTDPVTGTLKGHTGTISCLTFAPDGKSLVSGAKDGAVIVWDLSTRKSTRRFPGHKDMVVAVAYSPDGKALAATSPMPVT